MTELVLHVGSKRFSSWSLRPYLALSAAGAPFRTETIALDQPDTKWQILAINPAGKVPALRHGDLLVHDSLAICEYVNELFPEATLWPADREDRARARAITAEMHSGFTALRTAMPMDLRATKPGVGHTLEALADVDRICHIWRTLRAHAPGGPFLFGHFTIADAFFAPVTTRFTTYQVALDDTCQAYVATVQALPGFQAWLADARAPTATP